MPQDNEGLTAAMSAAYVGQDKCLQKLIDAGADLNAKVLREEGRKGATEGEDRGRGGVVMRSVV